MPPNIAVRSCNAEASARRTAAADRVVAQFRNQLPDRRLLCFFAAYHSPAFAEYAESNVARGLYMPVRRDSLYWASEEVIYCLHGGSISYFSDRPEFDHLIYVDGNACSDAMAVGLTLTFAHELQHFVQHCKNADLWAANKMILTLCKRLCDSDFQALNLKSFQVPTEEEAIIVSKRTAENIFGPPTPNGFTGRH